ncbi:hypothetical protein JXB28_00855 [Candidatus Woesearchaeota archaeon]|nr:hypothetical protein [Candidatus Woesearchaeota archaeon]
MDDPRITTTDTEVIITNPYTHQEVRYDRRPNQKESFYVRYTVEDYHFDKFMLDNTQFLTYYLRDIYSYQTPYDALKGYLKRLSALICKFKKEIEQFYKDVDVLSDTDADAAGVGGQCFILRSKFDNIKDTAQTLLQELDHLLSRCQNISVADNLKHQDYVEKKGPAHLIMFIDSLRCQDLAEAKIRVGKYDIGNSILNSIMDNLQFLYSQEQDLIVEYLQKFKLFETHVHAHLGMTAESLLKLMILNYDKVKCEINNYSADFKKEIRDMMKIVESAKDSQDSLHVIQPFIIEEFNNKIAMLPQESHESFSLFQQYCDFIDKLLSISELDKPAESEKIYTEMCKELYKKGIRYAELRKNLKDATDANGQKTLYYNADFQKERLLPIITGIEKAELELLGNRPTNKAPWEVVTKQSFLKNKPFRAYIILGLRRFRNHESAWQTISQIIQKEPFRGKICGLDFNGDESFDNPTYYKGIFEMVKNYNKTVEPHYRLGLTFHSGEIYDDRSLETAIRWIHELADIGVDRVGHANILGITNFDRYKGKLAAAEPLVEVRNQAEYDLKNRKGLMKFGVKVDEDALVQKIRICNEFLSQYSDFNPGLMSIMQGSPVNLIMNNHKRLNEYYNEKCNGSGQNKLLAVLPDIRPQPYTDERIKEIVARQAYVLSVLKKKKVIIETNPTSNVALNYDITAYTEHPIKKFLEKRVKFSINTDDPLIFDSDLLKEYSHIIQHLRLKSDQIAKIIKDSKESAFRYSSSP